MEYFIRKSLLKSSHETTAAVLLVNFSVFTQLTTNLRRMCKSRFILEVYINIYLRLYTTIFHNSNYNFYLVRGDMSSMSSRNMSPRTK